MSKKPSSTSDASRPPDLPVFYIDENLSSPELGKALRQFSSDWSIVLHTDKFRRGAQDVDVIRDCARLNWVMVSCDDRIRYVPRNKKAAIESKLRAFMLGEGNYRGLEIIAALIAGRHRMIGFNRRNAPPFFARLFINGKVARLDDKRQIGDLSSRDRTVRKYGGDVFTRDDASSEAAS